MLLMILSEVVIVEREPYSKVGRTHQTIFDVKKSSYYICSPLFKLSMMD